MATIAANTIKTPRGFIVYQGPSLIDGSPIVAIALTHSSNRKTGDMVQTYILRADVAPLVAVKTGEDAGVCGDCKHRPANGGACYVNIGHGPRSVFAAFERGNYPAASDVAALGAGRMVRLGTYGDPAAVPVSVWLDLVSLATGRTGYTHQWAALEARYDGQSGYQCAMLRNLVLASVDSPAEQAEAQRMGWRTFRIRTAEQPVMAREMVCPASDEAGKRLTCNDCGACDGAQRGAHKASVVIIAHGMKARRFIGIAAA